ncbi:MAG: agmatinase [Chloroflexi bacterium]|nr:agmatinase [Chloroflexota bacterium]
MKDRQPVPPQEMQGDQPWPERWTIPRSFFGAPLCQDLGTLSADIAFIGVPFDQGTVNRPGARFGPNAVRDTRIYGYVSTLENTVAGGYFDIDADAELLRGVTMADCGDVNVVPADVQQTFERLTATVRKMLDQGAFPVIVGGDHSITFPAVRGFDRYPSLDIVHFDAHMDYEHHYQGSLYWHGSPIRRCAELPFVRNITSIGVRVARRKPYEAARERGNLVITTERLRQLGPQGAAALVPRADVLYVTLDIDVLDPAQAPGTGTPAPGGLTYFEVRDALREVMRKGTVVGMDVVEVAPSYDWAQNTAQVAAKLIIDVLSVRFPSREGPLQGS